VLPNLSTGGGLNRRLPDRGFKGLIMIGASACSGSYSPLRGQIEVQGRCKPNAESSLYAEAEPDFAVLFIKALQRYTFSLTPANISAIFSCFT